MASRYVNANLNNAFYDTNRNAAKKAFNQGAMLFDGVVGGAIGGLTYTGNPIYPYVEDKYISEIIAAFGTTSEPVIRYDYSELYKCYFDR